MGGLTLLPGEREVLRLHPSPLGWLPRYGLALLPAAWGAALWAVFHSARWLGRPQELAPIILGSPFAAHLWSLGGLLLGGQMLGLARRDSSPFWTAVGLGVAASVAAIVLPLPAEQTLPLLVAAGSVVLLLWAELRRLGTHHHVTNLRLVVRTSFPRRGERSERHAELSDVDVRQGPLGRLLDVGTLLPLATPPAPHPLRLVGTRRLRRVLHLVEVLVRQATASDYLRERQGLEAQQAEALAALQRR
ncbi:MAG: hypothetical protein QOI63_159 [Thermoplasmata archaeon]|jgi:hypothetical protein|nr:hypothetical protein [Thermoplasmata archaeon]